MSLCNSSRIPQFIALFKSLTDTAWTNASRYYRNTPPAHYTLKIDSFSNFLQFLLKTGAKNYESEIFEAGGYKWRFSLYPNGDRESSGAGYISMYLVMQETDALPHGWEATADIKLFVFNQITDNFWTIQDATRRVRRCFGMKIEVGFAQLLEKSLFLDARYGFLVDDKCLFGAEISVCKLSGRGEHLSFTANVNGHYTWIIRGFSASVDKVLHSDAFNAGNFKWRLYLCPKGDSKGTSDMLSLYLSLADFNGSDKVCAEFKLRIWDQPNRKDLQFSDAKWFTTAQKGFGWTKFHSLSDITDPANGYLANDTLIVEAEVTCLCTGKAAERLRY